MTRLFVYITDEMEFIHKYPQAPDEVAYLRELHRHMVHIKVKVEVYHNDREIEFIILKHQIHNHLSTFQYEETCSCEMLANVILQHIQSLYGKNRDVEIIISEDGENGCQLIYKKEDY